MGGSSGIEERGQYVSEEKQHLNRGWLWVLTVLLVGTVIALIISFRISSYAVNKSRQASDRIEALQAEVRQHELVNQQRVLWADSAMAVAKTVSRHLQALNARLHELASAQYAIEVRADRLDSTVTEVAAGLEELDQSVQKDFNFVADRIDTALAVADAATVKASEAQQSVTQLRSGFEVLRSDTDRRIGSMKWQNRLSLGLGVVNSVVWGKHIAPDSHHK